MSALPQLATRDKRVLLRWARTALQCAAAGKPAATPARHDTLADALLEPQAVFVSLHTVRSHRLRGCIGCLEARHPLVEAVVENAYAAATRDPRFDAVRPDEVEHLEIEISVLGSMVEVRDVLEIQVGRGGIGVSRDGRRGILLPQVPVQLGWDRDTFLDNVCRKAELPADAWRHGATIQRFVAVVFSEAHLAEGVPSDSDS